MGDSGKSLHVASLDGSTRRTVTFDPQPRPAKSDLLNISSASGDGRFLFVVDRGPSAPNVRRAYLYDTQTRALRKLTDSLGTTVSGRGGRYRPFRHETGEFVFLQRTGGTADNLTTLPREIRAAKPNGANRLVRRVRSAADQAGHFIVDGERGFWTVTKNDTSTLFFAKGAAPAAKIWTTTERIDFALLSNDGTRMAVSIQQPPVNGFYRARFQFLRIDANGKVTTEGSSATFGRFYDAYWTPGDQALVALEYPGADLDTCLIRIPVNGSAVSYIVKPGVTTFWDHYLSPDGKYSLLPAESARGASIWRIDLDAAQRDWKRGSGKE